MLSCSTCREAVSARLDGEPAPVGEAEVAAHLRRCGACSAFAEQASDLHRRLRVAPAAMVPDLTVPILLAAGDRQPPLRARTPGLRWLAALVGLAQAAVAVAGLVGAGHAGRDLAVFELAVAAAFLVAAWKPARAAALVPVVGVLAVLEVVVAVINVAGATATVVGELPHLVPLIGVGVLALLASPEPRLRSISRPTLHS